MVWCLGVAVRLLAVVGVVGLAAVAVVGPVVTVGLFQLQVVRDVWVPENAVVCADQA